MRYLWCLLATFGVICISYAAGTPGNQPVLAFLGGSFTAFGLVLATTPGASR
jgi:hypothetical protein